MADLVFWQTLLAGSAGGGITLAGQWLQGRQARRNALEALHRERDLAKADRRDQFELEVLTELRADVGTLIDEAYSLRAKLDGWERDNGPVDFLWEDPEFAPVYQAAWAKVDRARPALLDPHVRDTVADFASATTAFTWGRSDAPAWAAYSTACDDVHRAIGERIQALYGGPGYHAGIRSDR